MSLTRVLSGHVRGFSAVMGALTTGALVFGFFAPAQADEVEQASAGALHIYNGYYIENLTTQILTFKRVEQASVMGTCPTGPGHVRCGEGFGASPPQRIASHRKGYFEVAAPIIFSGKTSDDTTLIYENEDKKEFSFHADVHFVWGAWIHHFFEGDDASSIDGDGWSIAKSHGRGTQTLFQVRDSMTIGFPGGSPKALAGSKTTNNVYVTGENAVNVLDLSGVVRKTIPFDQIPLSLAIDEPLNRVYVGMENEVKVIDSLNDDTVVNTIPIGASALAVDSTTHTVYALGNNTMSVIDGGTNTVTHTISIPATGGVPYKVAVDEAAHKVYVGVHNGGISVIDGSTNTVTTTIPINAEDLAVDDTTHKVYVATSVNESVDDTVSVIDGRTDTVTVTIPVRNASGAVAVDKNTQKVYVEAAASGLQPRAVTVIDGMSNAVTNTIFINEGTPSSTMGIVAQKNRIYLANSGSVGVIELPWG